MTRLPLRTDDNDNRSRRQPVRVSGTGSAPTAPRTPSGDVPPRTPYTVPANNGGSGYSTVRPAAPAAPRYSPTASTPNAAGQTSAPRPAATVRPAGTGRDAGTSYVRTASNAPHRTAATEAPPRESSASVSRRARGGQDSGGHKGGNKKAARVLEFLILAVVLVLVLVLVVPRCEKRATVNDDPALAVTDPSGGVIVSGTGGLMITEIMSANSGAYCSADGEYYDWVELCNTSDTDLSLTGFGLTDKQDRPNRFVFDEMTLGAHQYMIVFCSGLTGDAVPEGELHAAFKLGSAGDTIHLCDTYGNAMQSVAIPQLGADISYGFDAATAEWKQFTQYTPGFANDDAGWEAYTSSLYEEGSLLVLNEVMTNNKVTLKDGYGEYNDWIEVFNGASEPMDISGYGLSDSVERPKRWSFPEGTVLQPGEYLVITCSKKNSVDPENRLHSSFGLNSARETVVLADKRGHILDEVEVNGLEADSSYGRIAGGEWTVFTKPTPGFINNDDGYNAFRNSCLEANTTGICIMEVMTNNVDTLSDEFGEYASWIELMNRSSAPVDLAGFGLTDNSKHLAAWTFPSMTLNAGERVLVYANGKGTSGALSEGGKLNANFSVSSSGETLVLTDPEMAVIDVCQISRVPAGMSVARAEGENSFQSAFLYSETPTPGSTNSGTTYLGMCDTPNILTAGGLHDEAVTVEISVPQGTTVYYTMDCTVPTTGSYLYNGPITVSSSTVIRTRAFRDGYLGSETDTATYLIGEEHTLAVVSVVAEPDDLFSDEKGIYALGAEAKAAYTYPSEHDFPYSKANFNKNWEKAAHIELVEANGSVSLDQNFGLRIFGAYSRGHVKKSFACMARGMYGEDTFDAPLFDNLPYESYKSFVLRCGASEWNMTMIRDVLNSSLALDYTDLLAQSYKPCVLYLNGQYWGVYYIQEKTNANFVSLHTGGAKENVNLLVGNGNKASYVQEGTNEDYMALLEYVETHDLSIAENYEYVKSKVDVQNFIDYMLVEMYCGNTDTGNIKFYMSKDVDGRWRWILFDTDWSFMTRYIQLDMVEEYLNPKGHGVGNMFNTTLQCGLLKNSDFRELFMERAGYITNTMYNPDTVVARINELESTLDPEMERDRTYWNQYSKDDPNSGAISYSGWKKMVDRLREYATSHPAYFKEAIRKNLNMTSEEYTRYFGE